MAEAQLKPKSVDGTKPEGAAKSHQGEGSTVEAPPPPDIAEPDPGLTPEEAEHARKRYLLRRFWISARGYWSHHGDSFAWPCTLGLLAMIVLNVGFQYGINLWNRKIFDAIERHDAGTVYYLSAVFLPLVLGSVALVTAQVLVRMMIQRRWRSWLTKAVIQRWLANGRYYQLNLIGGDCLYGRYWGAVADIPFLHFELCYYQAIEHAIRLGLPRVEAGAQGQHKIARGYLPTGVYSAHYIADPALRAPVARYLDQERAAVRQEMDWLTEEYSPFREGGAAPSPPGGGS